MISLCSRRENRNNVPVKLSSNWPMSNFQRLFLSASWSVGSQTENQDTQVFTPESNMCYYQYRFHKKVKSLSSRSLCSPVKWQIFEQRGENVSGSLPIFGLDFLSPALMVYFPAFLAEDVKFNITKDMCTRALKPSVKTTHFSHFAQNCRTIV